MFCGMSLTGIFLKIHWEILRLVICHMRFRGHSRYKGPYSIFSPGLLIQFPLHSGIPYQHTMVTSFTEMHLCMCPELWPHIILYVPGPFSKGIPAGCFLAVVLLTPGVMQIITVPLPAQGCGGYRPIIICHCFIQTGQTMSS